MSASPRYRLLRVIASGGMAQVYEAVLLGAEGFERRVALKRILPQHAGDPALRRMFLDEARIASQLHHANIVSVLDYGTIDGAEFLAMEYVDGPDAWRAARMARQLDRPIPLAVALHVGAEIAEALAYLHAASDARGVGLGLVHRDVTPHNILLSWQGSVRLSDFGIAFGVTREQRTRTGIVKGKAEFMAPEQSMGAQVSGATDVFALGRTINALVGEGNAELVPSVAEIVHRCGSPQPAGRPRPAELAAALARFASQQTDGQPRAALRDWLAPLRSQIDRRSPLDEMLDLALVAVGERELRVERTSSRTQPMAASLASETEVHPPSEAEPPQPPVAVGTSPTSAADEGRPRWLGPLLLISLLGAVIAAFVGLRLRGGVPAASVDAGQRRSDAAFTASLRSDAVTRDVVARADFDAPADSRLDSPQPRVTRIRRVSRPKVPRTRPPVSVGRGWIRVGGRQLAGLRVEIDGALVGYAPFEHELRSGRHRIVIRDPQRQAIVLQRTVDVAVHHTRTQPLRLIH